MAFFLQQPPEKEWIRPCCSRGTEVRLKSWTWPEVDCSLYIFNVSVVVVVNLISVTKLAPPVLRCPESHRRDSRTGQEAVVKKNKQTKKNQRLCHLTSQMSVKRFIKAEVLGLKWGLLLSLTLKNLVPKENTCCICSPNTPNICSFKTLLEHKEDLFWLGNLATAITSPSYAHTTVPKISW